MVILITLLKDRYEDRYGKTETLYQKTDMAVLFAEQTNECYFKAMVAVLLEID